MTTKASEADVSGRELLDCPFCGEPGETEFIEDACWGVGCHYCDFQIMDGPVGVGWWPSEQAAINRWNTRAAAAIAKGEK